MILIAGNPIVKTELRIQGIRMVLISARLPVSEKGSNQKPETLREEHLPYAKILEEVRSAITMGYEMAHVINDEFIHAISFLKYRSGDKAVMILAIRGTQEEIDSLQQDPVLKKH